MPETCNCHGHSIHVRGEEGCFHHVTPGSASFGYQTDPSPPVADPAPRSIYDTRTLFDRTRDLRADVERLNNRVDRLSSQIGRQSMELGDISAQVRVLFRAVSLALFGFVTLLVLVAMI